MALSIAEGSGTFLPIIKYDAKSGKFTRRDRSNDGSGWVSDDVDITEGFAAIFDMESIQEGWIDYNTGGAPSFIMSPAGTNIGQQPTAGHKRGFKITLKLYPHKGAPNIAGDEPVREWSANSRCASFALSKLHTLWKDAKDANPGKLPVVQMTGTDNIKTRNGTNKEPVFVIKAWVPRPDDLTLNDESDDDIEQPVVAAKPVKQPAATGSTRAAPPPAAKKPAQAMADDLEDFG